ncbi:hypothetical protein C7M84_005537 [Penaeus vannamei]|uniref:Uncharacterized protein n=1 Tax=Penaeus vannamei TaxID=6689 RepID=A0A3R7MGK3_PENVA|nr:hypothetical protein C7M84_005537 [Penaeus vannamei]
MRVILGSRRHPSFTKDLPSTHSLEHLIFLSWNRQPIAPIIQEQPYSPVHHGTPKQTHPLVIWEQLHPTATQTDHLSRPWNTHPTPIHSPFWNIQATLCIRHLGTPSDPHGSHLGTPTTREGVSSRPKEIRPSRGLRSGRNCHLNHGHVREEPEPANPRQERCTAGGGERV